MSCRREEAAVYGFFSSDLYLQTKKPSDDGSVKMWGIEDLVAWWFFL